MIVPYLFALSDFKSQNLPNPLLWSYVCFDFLLDCFTLITNSTGLKRIYPEQTMLLERTQISVSLLRSCFSSIKIKLGLDGTLVSSFCTTYSPFSLIPCARWIGNGDKYFDSYYAEYWSLVSRSSCIFFTEHFTYILGFIII